MKRITLVLLIMMGIMRIQDVSGAELTGSPPEGGFHGSITVGGALTTGNPGGLAVHDDNKKIDRLDKHAESITEGNLVIMGNLSYSIERSGTTFALAYDLESEGVTFSIGQSLPTGGTVTLGVGYGQEEVWRDPYLVGRQRSETDCERYRAFLTYEAAESSGLRLAAGYARQDVDVDTIGERFASLKRDGHIYEGEIGYAINLGRGGV